LDHNLFNNGGVNAKTNLSQEKTLQI